MMAQSDLESYSPSYKILYNYFIEKFLLHIYNNVAICMVHARKYTNLILSYFTQNFHNYAVLVDGIFLMKTLLAPERPRKSLHRHIKIVKSSIYSFTGFNYRIIIILESRVRKKIYI